MRKLLLASVAVLGASMGVASVANAQAPTPAPGTISVRLNGLVRFYANYVSDNAVTNSQAGFVATGAANPAQNGLGRDQPDRPGDGTERCQQARQVLILRLRPAVSRLRRRLRRTA